MSDLHPGGGAKPDGGGTQSGGGGPPAHPNVGGTNAGITNQPILPLDPSVHAGLQPHQHHALKTIQLEFARDVSKRAADAYQQTLDVISSPENPLPSVD